MKNLIRLPPKYGPKRPAKRGRPPKNQPRATIHYLWQYREAKQVDRIARESQDPEHAAYSLYCEANQLDESSDKSDVDKAREMYERAIQLDPSLAVAYTNLGNIAFRRRDIDTASSYYHKALELSPEQPEALYNLGYLELENGFPMAAITLFKRAIASDPHLADAWFNYAMALEEIGAPAKLQWQRYLSIEPNGSWADIARRHLG